MAPGVSVFGLQRPRWRGAGDGTKENLDVDIVKVAILQFHHLVKPFLTDGDFDLLVTLVLAFHHRPPYRTLALLVALHASLQWDVEEHEDGRHLELPR